MQQKEGHWLCRRRKSTAKHPKLLSIVVAAEVIELAMAHSLCPLDPFEQWKCRQPLFLNSWIKSTSSCSNWSPQNQVNVVFGLSLQCRKGGWGGVGVGRGSPQKLNCLCSRYSAKSFLMSVTLRAGIQNRLDSFGISPFGGVCSFYLLSTVALLVLQKRCRDLGREILGEPSPILLLWHVWMCQVVGCFSALFLFPEWWELLNAECPNQTLTMFCKRQLGKLGL